VKILGAAMHNVLLGAACGCFIGAYVGGLVGIAYGSLIQDVSIGLDVALVGASFGIIGGAILETLPLRGNAEHCSRDYRHRSLPRRRARATPTPG
jgi:hypothetical protein